MHVKYDISHTCMFIRNYSSSVGNEMLVLGPEERNKKPPSPLANQSTDLEGNIGSLPDESKWWLLCLVVESL